MTQEFSSKIPSRNLSQPNAWTCQATCVAMVSGDDPLKVRQRLEALGNPGDPYVMGQVLQEKFGSRYIFDPDATMNQIKAWLQAGEFLITHGWFTGPGHVIALDGVQLDPATLSYKISVKDPWSEFSFPAWSYNNPSKNFFDGYYSSWGLYAAIVAGSSCSHAASIYARGELDSNRPGAWVHRVTRG